MTEVGWRSLVGLRSLERLDVSGNEAMSGDLLLVIGAGGRLRSVKVRHCRRVKECDIRALAAAWPNSETYFYIF